MSAPDTSLTKQKKRHWPVFAGIASAAFLVIVTVIALSPVEETAEDIAATTE